MLVSIVAAPYSWLFDQALAIPALLEGAYRTRSRNLVIALALLSAFVEVAMLANVWKPSSVYLGTLWAAPAWLIWYLLARNTDKLGERWASFRASRRIGHPQAQNGDAGGAGALEQPAATSPLDAGLRH
jgi:hypothetical protein